MGVAATARRAVLLIVLVRIGLQAPFAVEGATATAGQVRGKVTGPDNSPLDTTLLAAARTYWGAWDRALEAADLAPATIRQIAPGHPFPQEADLIAARQCPS